MQDRIACGHIKVNWQVNEEVERRGRNNKAGRLRYYSPRDKLHPCFCEPMEVALLKNVGGSNTTNRRTVRVGH